MTRLVERRLDTTEERVEAMQQTGDSLERVELTIAIEAVLDALGSKSR